MPDHELFAPTPEPPYYAVIFASVRTEGDQGYAAIAQRMAELAARMPGYLGAESVRASDGSGITVSYWKDEASIGQWKQQAEHLDAQHRGQSTWYRHYSVRIARIDRAYTH